MRLKTLLAATVLTVVAVLAAPVAASAAAPAPITASVIINVAPGSTITIAPAAGFNCNTGMLCLYNDANYSGTVTAYTNPAHGCHSLSGSPADNKISSVHNYLTHDIQMDTAYTCNNTLGEYGILAGHSEPNFAGSGWNDTFSSFWVYL